MNVEDVIWDAVFEVMESQRRVKIVPTSSRRTALYEAFVDEVHSAGIGSAIVGPVGQVLFGDAVDHYLKSGLYEEILDSKSIARTVVNKYNAILSPNDVGPRMILCQE